MMFTKIFIIYKYHGMKKKIISFICLFFFLYFIFRSIHLELLPAGIIFLAKRKCFTPSCSWTVFILVSLIILFYIFVIIFLFLSFLSSTCHRFNKHLRLFFLSRFIYFFGPRYSWAFSQLTFMSCNNCGDIMVYLLIFLFQHFVHWLKSPLIHLHECSLNHIAYIKHWCFLLPHSMCLVVCHFLCQQLGFSTLSPAVLHVLHVLRIICEERPLTAIPFDMIIS